MTKPFGSQCRAWGRPEEPGASPSTRAPCSFEYSREIGESPCSMLAGQALGRPRQEIELEPKWSPEGHRPARAPKSPLVYRFHRQEFALQRGLQMNERRGLGTEPWTDCNISGPTTHQTSGGRQSWAQSLGESLTLLTLFPHL